MARDYRDYLKDIIDSINLIQSSSTNYDYARFINDKVLYSSCLFNLQIIGEATLNIPDRIKEKYPQVEWRDIGGLRNLIAHGYYKLKPKLIWNIVKNELPTFGSQIQKIIELEKSQNTRLTETSKSIYPKQRERAEKIIPIVRRLVESLNEQNLEQQLEIKNIKELALQDYQVRFEQNELTLIIKNKADKILIKSTLKDGEERLDFAGGLENKDFDKWQTIEQEFKKLYKFQQSVLETNKSNFSSLSKGQELLKQEYERLKYQVLLNPSFTDAGVKQVDLAVAMLVIKNCLAQNLTEDSLKRVFKVLSQSDLVQAWKQSLPDAEYQRLSQQYINNTWKVALEIRQNAIQQQQEDRDLEL